MKKFFGVVVIAVFLFGVLGCGKPRVSSAVMAVVSNTKNIAEESARNWNKIKVRLKAANPQDEAAIQAYILAHTRVENAFANGMRDLEKILNDESESEEPPSNGGGPPPLPPGVENWRRGS